MLFKGSDLDKFIKINILIINNLTCELSCEATFIYELS